MERGKRPISDEPLDDQSLIVVRQHFETLEVMSFDFALPPQEGVALIDLVLRGIRTLANLRVCVSFMCRSFQAADKRAPASPAVNSLL